LYDWNKEGNIYYKLIILRSCHMGWIEKSCL